MKSQTKQILGHLRAGHAITPLDALNRFRCFRLASRINEIRRAGIDVETSILKSEDGARYAEYRLRSPQRELF